MDVFLVPVGPARYELYCEVPDEPAEDGTEDEPGAPPPGVVRRYVRSLRRRFNQMLAEAERERRHGRPAQEPVGRLARINRRIMRWVAESIAEQRLLWTLRRRTDAVLHYPADMPEANAAELLRKQLGRDFDKHQFWLVIDTLLFIGSGLLALVPGPNLIAYYFAFRMVGHFLSLRGARKGLREVTWSHASSVPLSELREALTLAPSERDTRVEAIAAALGLEHFPKFFKRSATPGS